MALKIYGGFRKRKFKYKGMVFIITRASDGSGWYCDMAYREGDRAVIETKYWTTGDVHYYRLRDVMNGIKSEIDSNNFKIYEDMHYSRDMSFV